MKHMKADRLVKSDWIMHRGQEWIISGHPAPEDVMNPTSKLRIDLSRIGGERTVMRIAPTEPVEVTRPWPTGLGITTMKGAK